MTDTKLYTDTEVKTAAAWLHDADEGVTWDVALGHAESIIRLVAPALIRRAKAEALRGAAGDLRPERYYDGPGDWGTAEWLEQRADLAEVGKL